MNNISKVRKKAGLSQAAFGQLFGAAQNTVCNWENGKREPDFDVLKQIAEHFNVSIDYLLGKSSDEQQWGTILGTPSPGAVRIPVLGRVAAGTPLYTAEEIIDWEEIPEAMAQGNEFFALKIHGRSMEPHICDNDVVIVRRQSSCDNGSVAIVLVNGNEATCKRVKFTQQGITLISSNPEFEPMFYTQKEAAELPVEILGVVVELRRTLIS